MKLKRPNKFRRGQSPERMEDYLAVELQNTLTDISTALTRLSFRDNFRCQILTVTLKASSETEIRHSLKAVPFGRLIVRSTSNSIVDGATAWTAESIYLSNTSGSDQAITLVILG